jgi:hypothetical protein
VGWNGSESSEEAVSGGEGVFAIANQTRELLQLSDAFERESSFRQGSSDSPLFYYIYIYIYIYTYIIPPRNHVAPKMTFKMAGVKNVLTGTINGRNLGVA